ncbi:nucleoprotein TPR isoform X2 [Parasteatoda tepidariorum]|uniref:nucleoprotein TPR isoform X2 n=1 Tax=Parasteatoda tepidariorum TaxID=114398 RepID=UPI001C7191EB|nr:nucleoprotein TPR isoform X2 [Parasteatoda tepidariorum]
MEVCAKLENFFTEEELLNIPQSTKDKITGQFSSYENIISKLREENAESVAILEREQFRFEKETSTFKEQLQESTESCSKLKLQISELEESLSSVQKQFRELQMLHDSSVLESQSTKRDNELLLKEKRILSEQLEKRRHEIEKMNGDLKNLLEQVTSANESKFAAIASSEESKLKESSLLHQVSRLEQEKELLNRQIVDLNAELTQKNSEIHTLKREKSSNILEMKNLLEERADQLHATQKKLDNLKELVEEKDARIEALAEKIRQLNMNYCKAEEQFNLEVNAQAKLIDLHKNASEDNQKRVQELLSAFEEARKLLNESNENAAEMEKHCHELEEKCKQKLDEKQDEILKLKEELKRCKEAAQGLSPEKIEQLFPVAAATSKVIHSGMTLSELYSQYTKLQEELIQERSEKACRTRELNNILAEIEERTPFIQQKLLEFDKLNETIIYLKCQQSATLANNEKLLQERNDAKRLENLANRENVRLKSQVIDLNRQVQRLLKEVEEARGGSIKDRRDSFNDEDDNGEVTSSDDITGDKVISRHLVTFRDIEQLQIKNQQLLAAIRDLSQQHEELEKKVSNELSTKFEKEITVLSSELADLQKQRAKQAEMLETIIRQRDMYRVLLTSQGFSDSLLGHPEGSFGQHSTSFSMDSKEAKTALNQLQAEFDNYKKGKAENEKMLSAQLDKMRTELSDLRIQNAKLASQSEYSEERVKILQSNLETYKKEYIVCKDKNRQHTTMIVQHQQSIASLRQDLMQAQEKIAKADVAVENLKAERDLLKSIETRLLQEKESVVREQQHQSRMMANLQALQNNFERIESETKRNLEHQVEKGEKEIAILMTKLENAHNEYRSAVDIWEKQKKELQSKIDAEVERNRKTHEELVESYSQMHAIKQELATAKAHLHTQVTPEKERTIQSQARTPVKPTSPAPSLSEMKALKVQLSEAQSRLKALQEKLTITAKSSEQYLKMCEELELRVKEQDEINKQLKDSMDSVLDSSNKAKTNLEKKLEDMEKNNRTLMEENMKLSQNSGSQISELQKKVVDINKLIENYKNEAESAKKIAEQAREDCQTQVKLMHEIQEKYQRELLLHAEDVKKSTQVKEEHKKCSVLIEKLTEAKKASDHALLENKESWLRQEEIFQRETKALKSKICDLESCNNNLHTQLEMLGTQMAALQSKNWDDTPCANLQADLKDTHHLLQVIQFIKKEKEIAATQFDVAQSENVRLNLKVEQLTNELKSVRSELEEISSNAQAKAASEAQHAELLTKIERMNLLSESNNLLRMEKEALVEAKTKLENQLHQLQEKFQPLYEKEKELVQNVDVLTAENNALRSEVKNWQSRTNQLLEQSHKIGPQEYKNLMREMEELKSQKSRLTEELQRKQAEVSQLTAQVNSHAMHINSLKKDAEFLNSLRNEVMTLRQDVDVFKKDVENKDAEIHKLNDAQSEHQKNSLQLKKIARKYKQLSDEFKASNDGLEEKCKVLEEKCKTLEASKQEESTQEMQKKVSDSEKEVVELKEEINKQKQVIEKAKKDSENLQLSAKEKEEKAKKLLAQFRQKYSQLNREKESLVEEKSRLAKEIEEFKSQISAYSLSQEETAQQRNHSDAIIARLEKELKAANDLRLSERKQYDELLLKVSQQKPGIKSPIVGLGDRTSGGTEPLTANIKPITSPSTSGAASGLRHSPHPVSCSNRPTPTASIRPMAIGTAPPTQARMAAVLPTTATPPQSADDVVSSPSVAVPHATVQPTPATATVAPNTMAVTVSPVISEVASAVVQDETDIPPMTSVHPSNVAVSTPATALVPPRIEITETMPDSAVVDSPAPTTSVIVSPPATQTQVVTPTVKRPREESLGDADASEASLKRIRMVSEGSQTNQQHPTSVVAPTPNVAIVPAAQVIRSQSPAVCEPTPSTSAQPEGKHVAAEDIHSPLNPNSASEEELLAPDAEILEDDKEEQIIEWETQEEQETKIDDDFEAEVMEEETIGGEGDEDMQEGIDVRSPDDEDMTEEQPDDAEDMGDQPTSSDLDLLDNTSNMQMDADSSSLQSAPPEQCMAPPAFPPSVEPSPSTAPAAESIVVPIAAPVQRTPVTLVPPRIERQAPGNRQHLTPFTIPGQGSNFEEGDDSIVPSTPTLYVPRRADGFAEAVSSPHVPQVRFSFSSSESSPTQQGLSQLASQDGLGVDDTRMDLSQFDEGGRTVPSTPLQVSPPEVIVPDVTASLESVAASVSVPEIIVPTIKIETAEELSADAQNVQKSDASDSVFVDPSVIKGESSSKLDEKESNVSASDQPETSEAREETGPGTSKTDESASADSEQSSKSLSAPSLQRKPIVWSKLSKEPEATSPETAASGDVTQSPPSQGLHPTPVRGRTRARRGRYALSATHYSRGRGGEAAWPGSPRRGRPTRRRTMY